MADDIETRVTLLEKTAMSREAVLEREEKLLDRIDALMLRHNKQSEQTLEHTLKVFGHDMADQLQKLRSRIHEERDEKMKTELASLKAELDRPPTLIAPPVSPIRKWMAENWIWIGVIIVTVILLRPDLAGHMLTLL
jgi:hypothetical protein